MEFDGQEEIPIDRVVYWVKWMDSGAPQPATQQLYNLRQTT